MHKYGFQSLVPLKITGILVCQKILLNSSLRPGTEHTEIKMFFIASRPVSGFVIGLEVSFSVL